MSALVKVLLVTPSYHPIVGGSETAIRILSTKLNEMGVQTDVMTFNMNRKWNPIWREATEDNGLFKVFKVSAFNPARIFRINPLELIKMYVVPKPNFTNRFKEYDIIHFQGEADVSFLLFSFFVRRPKLWTSHVNYAKLPRLKKLFRLVFPRLAYLYIAHDSKLLSDYGVSTSRSLVFQSFGVDTETFRPSETKKTDNLILFVGRITRSKGLHILLKTLAQVTSPTRLAIIGPTDDMKYAETCIDMIKQLNERGIHSAKYLGVMDEKSLIPWYQKAAILVRPDLDRFSGGLTSLEALSCGTPIIGTGNHVVRNGVNGLTVSPNNTKELADALNELLQNRELREEYGMKGRKMIEECFSWQKIVQHLAKIYEAVLSNYRVRAKCSSRRVRDELEAK